MERSHRRSERVGAWAACHRTEVLSEVATLLPADMQPDMRVVLFGGFATGHWDARVEGIGSRGQP